MNFIDVILIIPILWFGYKGFEKGMVISMATLLALGIGIWAGLHFADLLSDLVKTYINERYESLISFSIIFIGVVILIMLLGKVLEKGVNMAQLHILNKIGGAVFGVCKVLLIASVIFMIFDGYDKKYTLLDEQTKNDSLLYEPVRKIAVWIIPSMQDSQTFK